MSIAQHVTQAQRGPQEGGLGSVPPDTEGERGLLQARLLAFGRVATLVSLGFYLLVNTLVQLGPDGSVDLWLGAAVNRWHLATTAVMATMWLVCRGPRRTRRLLEAIDVLGTVGIGAGFGLMGSSDFWHGDPTLPMVLAVTHTVGVRAVLIPSSARRSAIIHTLTLIPAVVSAYAMHRAQIADERTWSAVHETLYTALWCAMAVIVSTLTSYVIYGLFERVRQSRRLGQYTLEEKIGEGAMGTVYRARHALLRRATAIKLLHRDRSGRHDLARFEREVQLTSRLTHPNTVAIYDYGRTPEGVFYYAMEYLDGIDLEGLVRQHGPQPPARVIHVLRQVAGALGEAHRIGLIHRDVKPANIILCERGGVLDVAKVVDFGLVKEVDTRGDTSLTGANTITGTPLYMPPEAVRTPDSVDGRSDLYALAAVGYFLLAGRPVFEGDTVVAVLADHLHTTPQPPSERLGAPLPVDLERLVLRCLAKDPDDRPASADDLASELSRCADADGWTLAAARTWWAAHGATPHSVICPAGAEATSPVTLTVQLNGRDEAA